MAKAAAKVVFSLATRNRFWLGMTISVSTFLASSSMPRSAVEHAALALEVERLGDDADGEDALLLRGARDDRRGAGSGAAAHAGGDEDHVGAGKMIHDLRQRLFRGGRADLRLRAGAEPLRQCGAHLDAALGGIVLHGLGIGVGDDELDAFETGLDHVVDGVAAGAADAEDRDPRLELR